MVQFGIDALLCPLGGNGRSALASSAAEFLCAQGNEHMVQSAPFAFWMAVCSPQQSSSTLQAHIQVWGSPHVQ